MTKHYCTKQILTSQHQANTFITKPAQRNQTSITGKYITLSNIASHGSTQPDITSTTAPNYTVLKHTLPVAIVTHQHYHTSHYIPIPFHTEPYQTEPNRACLSEPDSTRHHTTVQRPAPFLTKHNRTSITGHHTTFPNST